MYAFMYVFLYFKGCNRYFYIFDDQKVFEKCKKCLLFHLKTLVKTLVLLSRYSNFYIFLFPSFFHYRPWQEEVIEDIF